MVENNIVYLAVERKAENAYEDLGIFSTLEKAKEFLKHDSVNLIMHEIEIAKKLGNDSPEFHALLKFAEENLHKAPELLKFFTNKDGDTVASYNKNPVYYIFKHTIDQPRDYVNK
jgi:hypothetical protein